MKRAFRKNTSFNWSEIRIIDDEENTFTQYMQDNEIGFTFSHYSDTLEKMFYKSADDCIKRLTERGILGIEVDYEQQKESERIGQIKLKTEQERIKNNPLEYKQLIAAL
jgi:hypothetical protein